MRFLSPTGIGDVTWALTKAKAIAAHLGDGIVDMHLSCHNLSQIETRAEEYVKRFPFVNSCRMIACGACLKNGTVTDRDGYYNYFDDGPGGPENTFCLMPNRALEHGRRLERWFPEYPVDWTITRGWQNTAEETAIATSLRNSLGQYAVVYFGPESGNTREGHNRGPMWTPRQWVELMREIRLPLVAIGATYDLGYYANHIAPEIRAVDPTMSMVYNFIGQTTIGQTLAIIRGSAFGVYYQCGLGIWSVFEGRPTCVFWRPEHNSIHARKTIRISGEMKTAWVPPSELESGRYLPAVYDQTAVKDIAAWAAKCNAI